MLKRISPEDWNNIPVPVCKAIRAILDEVAGMHNHVFGPSGVLGKITSKNMDVADKLEADYKNKFEIVKSMVEEKYGLCVREDENNYQKVAQERDQALFTFRIKL